MRKLILSAHVTLDGFMAGEDGNLDWHFANWNEEMAAHVAEEMESVDTLLLGRVTYQQMAKYWSSLFCAKYTTPSELVFSDRINEMQKIVFSRTLQRTDWRNSRLAGTDIVAEVSSLKRQKGKDIVVWGGIGIVSNLLRLELIDEYRFCVAPVLLGRGIRYSKLVSPEIQFRLNHARTFSNGVLLLSYLPSLKHAAKPQKIHLSS